MTIHCLQKKSHTISATKYKITKINLNKRNFHLIFKFFKGFMPVLQTFPCSATRAEIARLNR